MILGVSRFKVANGLETKVRDAFFDRPGFVDSVPGFLGMETFVEHEDPAAFYLLTRWTDTESFQRWHRSPEHHQSHKGIPKGLKLDPTFTKIILLDRLSKPERPATLAEHVADSLQIVTSTIARSSLIFFLVGDADGSIRECNPAAAGALGEEHDKLIGRCLFDYLPDESADLLKKRITGAGPNDRVPFTLNLRAERAGPFSLTCGIDIHPTHFVLLGEPPIAQETALQTGLHDLNNRLTVMARDGARKSKELAQAKLKVEATLTDLDQSFWHLRKVAEVLPICVVCQKVKGDKTEWQTLAEYLQQNALFLSHGCCPDCVGELTLPVSADAC